MKLHETEFKGLLVIEPDFFGDQRGFFMEIWQKEKYFHLGIGEEFVQDNLSYSEYGILRGLHYQNPQGQGKLVYVIDGEVYDVAVDLRKSSPTFGLWTGYYLSGNNKRQLFIPPGFAHGFCVTSNKALFAYKCTDYYNREAEKGIIWNDPELAIKWPIKVPILSKKDRDLPYMKELTKDDLPE